MSTGSIVQSIGAVVDIAFPREGMPLVYDALVLEADPTNKLVEQGLTFVSPGFFCRNCENPKCCEVSTRTPRKAEENAKKAERMLALGPRLDMFGNPLPRGLTLPKGLMR